MVNNNLDYTRKYYEIEKEERLKQKLTRIIQTATTIDYPGMSIGKEYRPNAKPIIGHRAAIGGMEGIR
jgi:hypothetical protein